MYNAYLPSGEAHLAPPPRSLREGVREVLKWGVGEGVGDGEGVGVSVLRLIVIIRFAGGAVDAIVNHAESFCVPGGML